MNILPTGRTRLEVNINKFTVGRLQFVIGKLNELFVVDMHVPEPEFWSECKANV